MIYSRQNQKWAKNQRGETIVEVLIAVGVIAFSLMAAFMIVTRNIAATQDVQEHSYAQKIVESQVEFLRINGDLPVGNSCFDDLGQPRVTQDCLVTNGGASFTKAITKNISGTYSISVSWTTIHGSQAVETAYFRP